MPKHLVGLARFCVAGTHRHELTTVALEAELVCRTHPGVSDIVHLPISRFPTHVARNEVVRVAREQKVDILVMVDDDMKPAEGLFRPALDFLMAHQGPAAIASPYCTAPPLENVNVFEWAKGSNLRDAPFATTQVVREDAARRSGIEMVVNAGTGYVFYTMSCFDLVRKAHPNKPFYDYSYSDFERHRVIETEDCWFHRHMYFAGAPMYVHWDFWSNHYKMVPIQKPQRMTDAAVGDLFMRQARAEVSFGGKDVASLIPQDVDGWCDFADVYDGAVKRAPEFGSLVEVGAWKGQSAILMARLIQRSKKQLRFTVVDHWEGSGEHHTNGIACDNLRAEFEANLKRHNVWGQVDIASGPSPYAAHCFDDASLDFVFLDASHDRASVVADIKAWLPKVKTGGILAGHDYGYAGVAAGVADVLGDTALVEIKGKCWVWVKKAPEKVPEVKPTYEAKTMQEVSETGKKEEQFITLPTEVIKTAQERWVNKDVDVLESHRKLNQSAQAMNASVREALCKPPSRTPSPGDDAWSDYAQRHNFDPMTGEPVNAEIKPRE